jgi:hypothetical protein
MSVNLLNPNGRYAKLDTAELPLADGRTVVYLRRRFLPPGSSSVVFSEHTVKDGDRHDLLAGLYLRDAEQFWRIADGNDAMDPSDLIHPPSKPKVLVTRALPTPPPAPVAAKAEPVYVTQTHIIDVREASGSVPTSKPVTVPVPPKTPPDPVTVTLINTQTQRLRIPLVGSDAIASRGLTFGALPDAGD